MNAVAPLGYLSSGEPAAADGAAIPDYFGVPGVTTKTFVSEGHANDLYLEIDWNTEVVKLSPEQFVKELRGHDPSIEVRAFMFSGGRIQLSATVMDEGEDVIVGEIIRKVLLAHS